MLASSSEYFAALREGNYLRFLEWPSFVTQKYSVGDEPLGSDALLDCLVFEWLNFGYSAEDAEKIAILYAVYELEPSPLAGKLAFALMTITSALFSCQTLHQQSLYGHTLPNTKMTAAEIIRFMEAMTVNMNGEYLGTMRDDFMQRSHLVDKTLVSAACKKISDITQLGSILEKYFRSLSLGHGPENSHDLYGARLGVVQSFSTYLAGQTELTEAVRSQIAVYVTRIRTQQPAAWEEEYLQKLSPPTLMEQTWRWVNFGLGFFVGVLPGSHAADDVELVNRSPD